MWYLSFVPNFVQISVIVTEIDPLMFKSLDVHLMTSRELTSGFDFWSRGHLRMAVMHLHSSHKTWCRYLYPVPSYWHFSEIKDGGRAILDFQVMWIWPFRRVDSVAFVFCTKFGSNICYCDVSKDSPYLFTVLHCDFQFWFLVYFRWWHVFVVYASGFFAMAVGQGQCSA